MDSEAVDVEALGQNPDAVALGRRGGLKGGPARAAAMTDEERSASASKAARARWGTPEPVPKPKEMRATVLEALAWLRVERSTSAQRLTAVDDAIAACVALLADAYPKRTLTAGGQDATVGSSPNPEHP